MNKTVLYLLLAIILATALYFLLTRDETTSLSSTALTDYAIKDTAAIGSIYIADRHGKEVILERGDGKFWTVNDTYKVLPHQIDLLLRTFYGAGVQQPVSKGQRETTMKVIAGDNRKVKVLDRDGKWMKTWYVGRSTANSQGTYALLETPEDGLSPEPVVIESRGFRGYLTSRFHTKVNDWRWTGLFYYPKDDIARIDVERPRSINEGFQILIEDRLNGKLKMMDQLGRPIAADRGKMSEYVDQFKEINMEHFNVMKDSLEVDSLLRLPADFIFTVTDKAGRTTSAKIFNRPTAKITRDKMGEDAPDIDPERVVVQFGKGQLASGQRLTFDRIMKERKDLVGSTMAPLN